MIAIRQKVLASQPFSVLIGATLVRLEPGAAEIHIPVKEELNQQDGFMHGGVVSCAADNAITFAGGSLLGQRVLTAEFKINFLKPCVGRVLVACASVVHQGKHSSVCRCEIFCDRRRRRKTLRRGAGTDSTLEP